MKVTLEDVRMVLDLSPEEFEAEWSKMSPEEREEVFQLASEEVPF